MYTFTFVAHPKPQHPRYGELGGAYATVFVNDAVAASAEVTARQFVEVAGWDIEELDDWGPVRQEDDQAGLTWFEYFDQARQDGICAVFNTWPKGSPGRS